MTNHPLSIEHCFPETKLEIVSQNIQVKRVFSFEESKKLRNWILDLRDEFCPPKSYINSSSTTIVVSNIQYGNISIAFSWSKGTFDLIVSCSSHTKECTENIKLFKMERYSQLYDMDFFEYLKNDYLLKSPNSIIIL